MLRRRSAWVTSRSRGSGCTDFGLLEVRRTTSTKTTLNTDSLASGTGVPAGPGVEPFVEGLPNLTMTSIAQAPAPSLEPQARESTRASYTDIAGGVSDPCSANISELNFSQANAEPAAGRGEWANEPTGTQRSATINGGDTKATKSSRTIADVLARLPLSKFRIVIGER